MENGSELKVDTVEVPNVELELTNKKENVALIEGFNPYATIDSQMEYAKILLNSGALPAQYKKDKPEAVILAANYGKELGFSFITALRSVYFVNGNPSLSTQAMVSLLLQKGVVTKTIKDFELIKKEDGTFIYDPGFEGQAARRSRRTIIRFYRKHSILGIVLEEDITYTTYEATQAGIYGNVWLKYPHLMIWYRTYSFGAKRVASDLLNGLTSVEELVDSIPNTGVTYDLDAEGNIKIMTA